MPWLYDTGDSDQPAAPAPDTSGATFGDVARSVGQGALDVGQSLNALGQAAEQGAGGTGDNARFAGRQMKGMQDELEEGITPGGKAARDAKVTDGSILSAPFSSIAMKAGRAAPSIAAFALFPEGAVSAAAGGAALGVGGQLHAALSWSDDQTDDQLKESSPVYKALRDKGMDKNDALHELQSEMVKSQDVLFGLVTGAATGVVGGQALGKVGNLGASRLGAAGAAGAEGFAGGAAQGFQGDIAQQHSLQAAGAQGPTDIGQAVTAGINTGAEFGGLSTLGGLLHGGHPAPDKPAPVTDDSGKINSAADYVQKAKDTNPALVPAAEAVAPLLEPKTDLGADTAMAVAKGSEGEGSTQLTPKAQAIVDIGKVSTAKDTTAAADPAVALALNPDGPPRGRAGKDFQDILNDKLPPEVADAAKKIQADEVQKAQEPAQPSPTDPTQPVPKPVADASKNIPDTPTPEAAPTTNAQQQKVLNGENTAALYTPGSDIPPAHPQLGRVVTKKGTFDFDKTKTTDKEVRQRAALDQHGELLGLGPHDKQAVADTLQPGEQPRVVAEVQPDGTPVKEAAISRATEADTTAALVKNKSPANAIVTRPVDDALAARAAKITPEGVTPTGTVHDVADPKTLAYLDKRTLDASRAPKRTGLVREQMAVKSARQAFMESARQEIAKADAEGRDPAQWATDAQAAKKGARFDYTALQKAHDEYVEGNQKAKANAPPEPEEKPLTARQARDAERNQRAGEELPKEVTHDEYGKELEGEALEKSIKDYMEKQDRAGYVGDVGDSLDTAKSRELAPDEALAEKEELEREQKEADNNAPKTGTEASGLPPEEGGVHGAQTKDFVKATPDGRTIVKPADRKAYMQALTEEVKRRSAGLKEANTTFSDNIPPEIQGILNGWVKMFGLKTKINFHTEADAIEGNSKVALPISSVDYMKTDAGRRSGGFMDPGKMKSDGEVHIVYRDKGNPADELQTLAHEIGHVFDREVIKNAPKDVQEAIQQAFDEYMAKRGRDTNKEFIDNTYPFAGAETFKHGEGAYAADAPFARNPDARYFSSKTEWIANQIAKWATSEAKPLGVVDRFMKAIADKYREILGTIQGTPKATDEFMARFLNDHVADVAERNAEALAPRKTLGLAKKEEIQPSIQSASVHLKDAVTGSAEASVRAAKSMIEDPIQGGKNLWQKLTDHPDLSAAGRKLLNGLTTNDQFGQKYEKLLPGLRDTFDLQNRAGVLANRLKIPGHDLIRDMIKSYEGDKVSFQKFQRLLNEQTMVGVDASSKIGEGRNAYLELSKDNQKAQANGTLKPSDLPMGQWEQHQKHADLEARYKELVAHNPEYKGLQDRLFEHYENAQKDMAMGHIQQYLRAGGVPEGDLAARAKDIYNTKASEEHHDALENEFGENIAGDIIKAKDMGGKNGVYVPLARHGDHVVTGRYKVAEPGNAIARPKPDTYSFATREEAHKFATESELGYTVKTRHYDPVTGERTTADNESTTGGSPVRHYEVTLQKNHTSFHDTIKEARDESEHLNKTDRFEGKTVYEPKKDYLGRDNEIGGLATEHLLNRLRKTDEYERADAGGKAQLEQAIKEAALSSQAGNHMQARTLPRRNVEGASEDAIRTFAQYNEAQANARAKIQYRPEIEQRLRDLQEAQREGRQGGTTAENFARAEALHEAERRLRAPDPAENTGAYSTNMKRINMVSYIDRMMRPSHLILHQTHLPMITAPIIAGRHGVAATYAAMAKTMGQSSLKLWGRGGADAWKAIGDRFLKSPDYNEIFSDLWSKDKDHGRLMDMVNTLADKGSIHPDAGVELHKLLPHEIGGGVSRALDRADSVFRQLTNSTEALNRYNGAAIAYRLEYAKGIRDGLESAQAHEKAVQYAHDTLVNSQGLFTSSNAAPLFKTWMRPLLQFKQFPQMIYHLMLSNVGKMKGFAAEKGSPERMEAMQAAKSMALLLGSSTVMTGTAGGLPLEAAKVAALLTKSLGLTSGDWNDLESWEHKQLSKHLGPEAAEWIMHGVSRPLLGVDVHHRLGHNSYFTYGLDDVNDRKSADAWAMEQAFGAPGGMMVDAFQGLTKMGNAKNNNDMVNGALKTIPLQVLRDQKKAWVDSTEGPLKNDKTVGDRVKEGLGFTPGQTAADYEKKTETKKMVQDYTQQRKDLMTAYADAKPQDRPKIWANMAQKFNKNFPDPDARVDRGMLEKYAQNKASGKADDNSYAGVHLGKRTDFIRQQQEATYGD